MSVSFSERYSCHCGAVAILPSELWRLLRYTRNDKAQAFRNDIRGDTAPIIYLRVYLYI